MKRRRDLLLCALTLGVALTGCGFRPLYGERARGPGVLQQLNTVYIAPIDDRLGQMVRNHLLDAMNPKGTPRQPIYRLDVAVAPFREQLAFREDNVATRVNLRVTASYALRPAHGDEVLTQGSARVIASYNITREEYATLIADRDAQARAAREIADEIVSRLAAWFDRPGAA